MLFKFVLIHESVHLKFYLVDLVGFSSFIYILAIKKKDISKNMQDFSIKFIISKIIYHNYKWNILEYIRFTWIFLERKKDENENRGFVNLESAYGINVRIKIQS